MSLSLFTMLAISYGYPTFESNRMRGRKKRSPWANVHWPVFLIPLLFLRGTETFWYSDTSIMRRKCL